MSAAIEKLQQAPGVQYMHDLYNSSHALITAVILSFIYSIVYIYLMSWFAEYLAWACVVLGELGLIFMGVSSTVNYISHPDYEDAPTSLVIGLACSIMAIVFAICICCGYSSLKLAIDAIDASADFLAATKRLILVSISSLFVMVLVLFIWIMAVACIYSMGDIRPHEGVIWIPQDRKVSLGEDTGIVTKLMLVMVFGLFWVMFLIKYQVSFIAMVSAATYYFDHKPQEAITDPEEQPNEGGSADVSFAMKCSFYYHFGSLCFGSFVIALVFLIRVIVYYVCQKAQDAAGGDNATIKMMACCLNCIMKCIEEIVDYINKAAFSYMSVSG